MRRAGRAGYPKKIKDGKQVKKKTRIEAVLLAVLGASLFFLQSCGSSESGESPGRLVLTGSSTVAPLAMEIGKQFEEEQPDVQVDVQTGGSSRGIADVRSGVADIGMASRSLNGEENDLLAYTIALDGISLIVHEDNPVQTLSDDQVRSIFTGNTSNWQEVGGNDAPITVVNKAEGRSTLELFLEHFGLEATDVQADVVIGDNEQGIKTVAGDPNSVGYVSIGTAEHDAADGVPIKLLPTGGVEASTENVRNGTFPLSRPLNLVTESQPEGSRKEFIDFATSQDVQDLVEEQFFVPIPR